MTSKSLPDPSSDPLESLDPSDPGLFESDAQQGLFDRLRREDPVHFRSESAFGPYWSVTRHADVVAVEKDPESWSSARGVTVGDPYPDHASASGFISMDGERHTAHRRAVQPVVSPRNLKRLEPLIRSHATVILDGLPENETFDWVDHVSIELTTRMLATLFDFPFAERRKLTYWSDVAAASPEMVGAELVSKAERQAALRECRAVFESLVAERRGRATGSGLDFVTALATSPVLGDLSPREFLGTLTLLIIGGNDTTRNSISGGVVALDAHPDQYRALREDPGRIPNAVHEIIRWQTPLAHMRRTATRDLELAGRAIRAGEKAVLWYVSANRDERVFADPHAFRIDRPNARQHLAFGLGVHFCMGSRLAELQLRVLWEEILWRFRRVEVAGPPERVRSNFVRGFQKLPVRVHRA